MISPQQVSTADPVTIQSSISRASVLENVQQICRRELRPLVRRIDKDGQYPKSVMHRLGSAGLYSQHLLGEGVNEQEIDMALAIEAMSLVGYECLSTAFCVWCHDACGWYLENTKNVALKESLKPLVGSGLALGATGLSNPMKFYSSIEKLKVEGKRVEGGYLINGCLPWVSNLDSEHHFGVVFEDSDDDQHRIMAILRCDHDGVRLCDGGRFIALEGSGTFAIRFNDCFVPDELVLADPADDYINAIRPGFVLMQVGMATGLVNACINLMRRQDRTHEHVNCFLPDRPDELEGANQELLERTCRLAQTPNETDQEFLVETLRARLDAGELSLKAAQACMLNGGARAYMESSNQFRKLREAYFVGVVTPATKHLRKEISRLKANESIS
ncbi:MAG: acyl-CoA dehydrogenase family protein [Rubripirellula sp.]